MNDETPHRTPRAPRVSLNISEEIIEQAVGGERNSSICIVAEAVKAAFPDARRVSADLQTVRFTDPKKGLRFTYLTPRLAQVMLVKYDQGVKPEPFNVQLRNGQVTPAGSNQVRKGQPLSEKQRLQRKRASEKGTAAKKAALTKAQLVVRNKDGSVADRVGGKTPPTAPATQRAFGLRGLER